jgi:TonB family protein
VFARACPLLVFLLIGCASPTIELPLIAHPADFSLPDSLRRSNQAVDGEVVFAVMIDEEGRLTDTLLAGLTHPELEPIAFAALHETQFMPARLRNRPVPAHVAVSFSFSDSQPRVTAFNVEHLGLTLGRRPPPPLRVVQTDQLDSPPRLIRDVQPQFTRTGSVKVQFFIDHDGLVRMPVIVSSTSDDLSASVLDAVTLWQFTPPTRQGRPVIAVVRQEIRFGIRN